MIYNNCEEDCHAAVLHTAILYTCYNINYHCSPVKLISSDRCISVLIFQQQAACFAACQWSPYLDECRQSSAYPCPSTKNEASLAAIVGCLVARGLSLLFFSVRGGVSKFIEHALLAGCSIRLHCFLRFATLCNSIYPVAL